MLGLVLRLPVKHLIFPDSTPTQMVDELIADALNETLAEDLIEETAQALAQRGSPPGHTW